MSLGAFIQGFRVAGGLKNFILTEAIEAAVCFVVFTIGIGIIILILALISKERK